MEFDEGSIFYSNQERGDGARADTESPASARIKYFQFIRTYREGNVFIYRDKLRQAVSLGIPELEVDLDHVMAWDDALADDLQERPAFHLPHFEQAALEAAKSMDILDPEALDMPSFQITLMSTKKRITIRELVSSQVSRKFSIQGRAASPAGTSRRFWLARPISPGPRRYFLVAGSCTRNSSVAKVRISR